jgi:hypothetical protein
VRDLGAVKATGFVQTLQAQEVFTKCNRIEERPLLPKSVPGSRLRQQSAFDVVVRKLRIAGDLYL